MIYRLSHRVWSLLTGGARPPGYAGEAGIAATAAVAIAGLMVGAFAAYVGQLGPSVSASNIPEKADRLVLEPNPDQAQRDHIVAGILAGEITPERLTPPQTSVALAPPAAKPRIVIIIDDMGVNRQASKKAINLPGPITFSFLPYARNVRKTVEQARAAGGEIMLHLPMEPGGNADPGPHALKTGMTGRVFIDDLEWNLSRFEGYVGVNNHMGSKLTANVAAMKTLLAYLHHQDVFFLDSLTTDHSAVRAAARAIGIEAFSRDVFLDAAVSDRQFIRKQLALAERIANKTGYAVAIGHPREETLDVLGPWLTTAPARGFELVYASDLVAPKEKKPVMQAYASALRL